MRPVPIDGTKVQSNVAAGPFDGTLLFAVDDRLVVWDANGHAPHVEGTVPGGMRPVNVASGPLGVRLAASGREGAIRMFDGPTLQAREPAPKGHRHEVVALAFSPDDGRLASLDDRGTLIVWRLDDATIAWQVDGVHGGLGMALDWSADGRWIATGGGDGHVALWDMTGSLVDSWKVDDDRVEGLAFSPAQPLLGTNGADGAVRLWRIDPQAWRHAARRIAGRELTETERQRHLEADDQVDPQPTGANRLRTAAGGQGPVPHPEGGS